MKLLRRLAPQTIATQIACLVVVAVVLGVALASAALLHFFNASAVGANSDILPAVRAARIAGIVRKAQETHSPQELTRMLETARSASVAIERVSVASLERERTSNAPASAFTAAIEERLVRTWGVKPLPNHQDDAIFVRIHDDVALKFKSANTIFAVHNLLLIQVTCALAIITVMILLLSFYALKRITAPLSAIALAARSFGQAGGEGGPLKGTGPREIKQVAEALQEMRERTRQLVDERTQMLEAISHDLRTPLTRLRLRAERLSDIVTRTNMLQDLAIINDMVSETLTYLRDGGRTEEAELTDLPSLLQTICAQFSDVGHDVAYEGPTRFPFACRAHALSRAVANVVDNATKHGKHVTVVLLASQNDTARIEVSDDGPGIPSAWRQRVFDPFFKGDSARRAGKRHGGFGLGLSIARDIIRRHGGEIELRDHAPRGLTVVISLTRVTSDEDRAFLSHDSAQSHSLFSASAATRSANASDRDKDRRSGSCRGSAPGSR
ncbi:MAG TPA: ATP-binding protein [Rhizobiaceae bacterium]|nr:ATP-binding protein [Rhizobiaceae bacterium]